MLFSNRKIVEILLIDYKLSFVVEASCKDLILEGTETNKPKVKDGY